MSIIIIYIVDNNNKQYEIWEIIIYNIKSKR